MFFPYSADARRDPKLHFYTLAVMDEWQLHVGPHAMYVNATLSTTICGMKEIDVPWSSHILSYSSRAKCGMNMESPAVLWK